jgi:hypothetical protein
MTKNFFLIFLLSLIFVLVIRDFSIVLGKRNDKDELLRLFNGVKCSKITDRMDFISPDSSRSFFHKCQFGIAPIVLSRKNFSCEYICTVAKINDTAYFSRVKLFKSVIFEDSSKDFRVFITVKSPKKSRS